MESRMSDKTEISLTESQQQAYESLESACEYSLRRGTICLVGDFQSGKTTLVRYFLSQKFSDPDKYCLNVNMHLLERLRKEGEDLPALATMKAKTRLIMEVALEEAIEQHFAQKDLLVLDAIEILYPYRLNLVSLVSRHTRDGKICIICVPENDKFAFDFSWGNCEIIRLEDKSQA
jgi:GTPase SAR1 family protein